MNRVVFAVVVVLVIGVIGYLVVANRNSQQTVTTKPTTTPTLIPSPTPTPRQISVSLNELNKSGQTGSAILTEIEGKVVVAINLTGSPAGVSQPAHIHVGRCPGVGAIKWPLTSVLDGKSETTLPDGVTLDTVIASLPLAVNVHKSSSSPAIYVSCGPIVATPGASLTPTQGTSEVSPTRSVMQQSSPTPSVGI